MIYYYYMTSTLRALHSKGYIITIVFFLYASSTERRIIKEEFEWKLSKKPLNSIKKTEEENWETNENILAL